MGKINQFMLFQLHFYTLYLFVPCQAPHLGGSTLSLRLKCIHVADCIAHSMLYYEGISSLWIADLESQEW